MDCLRRNADNNQPRNCRRNAISLKYVVTAGCGDSAGNRDMNLKPAIRALRRQLHVSLVWASLPLVFFSGLPSVSCACAVCHCGVSCQVSGHAAETAATPSAEKGQSQFTCCCCCCCGGHCDGHCPCCQAHKSEAKTPAGAAKCEAPHGRGYSAPSDQCRVSVSATAAVSASVVAFEHHQPLSLDIPAAPLAGQFGYAVQRFAGFDTGPPTDLVVTLRRLVI